MSLTDRELRWLRHIAIHGPQSSEFLLELVADTHRCRDTGLRTLQKLREREFLRLPPQQQQIAKADFHPYVYDLTRKAELYLQGLGDPKTTRPRGHWWHAFLTASITSAVAIEAAKRGYRYIPAHEILNRAGAALAIPTGTQKLIPDQLFALDYGGMFRSFVLEVDRGTEPIRSQTSRKSMNRMTEEYERLVISDQMRQYYHLKSSLVVLFAFAEPVYAAQFADRVKSMSVKFGAHAWLCTVPATFPKSNVIFRQISNGWRDVTGAEKTVWL